MSALRTLQSRAGTAAVLVGVLGASVLSTGTAYAFWTVVGSGSGTATATTAQPVTVSTASAPAGLYPGAALSGTVTISNPNPFAVKVTGLTFAAPTADGAHTSCTTTGVTFTSTVSATTAVNVPAKASNVTAPYSASMDSTASDGCQGATFTSSVTVTGQSS